MTKTFYEREIERIEKDVLLSRHLYVQVRQSKAFMERNYAEQIDAKKMAAAASMSRFHYIRIFRSIYGVTPRRYLRDLRMAKAKKMLANNRSVTDVCFDVGYESLPTFSSAFKRATGFSPKRYQTLCCGNLE